MNYAIGIWNLMEEGKTLPQLIGEYAGHGFDTISFLPQQIAGAEPAIRDEIVAALDANSLAATVHGNFDLSRADLDVLLETLGERLRCLTFDGKMNFTPKGYLFNVPAMAAFLAEVEKASQGTELRFGVEDFPLDALTLKSFERELEPVLASPRYGMLVDLGHLNMRIQQDPYFHGQSTTEYLGRLPLPVIEIHVHDNDGKRDLHQPLGDGNSEYEAAARFFKDWGFDGVHTIETVPGFHGATVTQDTPKIVGTLALWKKLTAV